MKMIKNISIKWKVMMPTVILAFLLFATCLQANIANARMMEYSTKIAQGLTEITPEVKDVIAQQESLYQGMKSSNTVKLIIAVFATVLLLGVSAVGVLKPLLRIQKQLDGIMLDIENGQADLSQRVDVKGKDEIGRVAKGINSFIASLEDMMN